MRKIIVYLFSILLLTIMIAKNSYAISAANPIVTTPKAFEGEQKEKIGLEEEKRTAYDQLKNNEFIYSYHHHRFTAASLNFAFPHLNSSIPHSFLERPERPPKRQFIFNK